MKRNVILQGDARSVLASGAIPPGSIQCCITSPPYYRLRRYGDCPGELGREPTVAEYIENLRAVFREVRRCLTDSGSAWIIIGDTYARHRREGAPRGSLLLVPQRLALALSADGWLARNVVAWHKTSALPHSAPDRLSPSWEAVLFITKNRRYHFDLDAIRVPHRSAARAGTPRPRERNRRYQGGNDGLGKLKAAGRVGHQHGANPRDVWVSSTATDRLWGHNATFPATGPLLERPILATCPEKVCSRCGAAYSRPSRIVSERTDEGMRHRRVVGTLRRSCSCEPGRATRGVVLDPFAGTGSTAVAAQRLGRDFLGIELNPEYVSLANRRIAATGRSARPVDGFAAGGRALSFCPPQEPSTTKGGAWA